MEVCRLYWWKHEGKTPKCSSAKIHRLVDIKLNDGVVRPTSFDDYTITVNELDGLKCEKHEDLI
ncbi:MAG: type I-C CRISPR-associated protein Cas7/Csd2, partial [Oscillospiraceae bacterium]|nr:type I-C CRISPR-associated protein Cas7/Csd2 [Oscillospiraceae bacterium]